MNNIFFTEINKYVPGVHKLNTGATEEEVLRAEEQLQIRLPQIYRDFLKKCKGGELFAVPVGTKISKVLTEESMRVGGFYLNNAFKQSSCIVPNIPKNFLIIATRCYGDLICLDLNGQHDDDAFIILWDHESGEIIKVWNGLYDWLIEELSAGKEMINYDGSDV